MINRRNVLKLGATTAIGVPLLKTKKARAHQVEYEAGRDYAYLSGTERDPVATTCALCPSRCAAIAYKENDYVVKIEGNPASKRTMGKLCAKGQAGVNQIYDPDRILTPLKRKGKRGEGKWEKISWDTALEEITDRLKKMRDQGEPEKFMFHHGWISASADRLINKVFLPAYGTGTVASNSCLGQSARLTAHELTWGGYEDSWDFENTRYVLNFGSNVMEAHTNHVALSRRLSIAQVDRNVKMVTFDVRLSNTGSKSDVWIQIQPGTDCAVVLAMCHVIMSEELYRGAGEEFLAFCQVTPDPNASTAEKVRALKDHLASFTPEWAEGISGVPAKQIREITVEFANTRPACVISSRGVSAQHNGVQAERAIQMLAAITGNIDNPGGRCLGVLPEWHYPTGPEEKPAVRKLDILNGFEGESVLAAHDIGHQVFNMIKEGSAGRPEVYMWYNYNPVFSNGNSQRNIDILKDESLIPFTVAVTPFYDESAALADLILPDAMYLECFDFEDGISPDQIAEYAIRQPVVPPSGEARDFKDVCCELAERMEFPLGFDSAEAFVEQTCNLTPVTKKVGGFNAMTTLGVRSDQEAKPTFYSYKKLINEEQLNKEGIIFDEASGVFWNWQQAGVQSEQDAIKQGYRHSPDAHKGYVAQKIGDKVYSGFKPARTNKSGYFEIYSSTLIEKGLPALPVYTSIPEHKELKDNELILTTFRVNVQTLSRTQNCKWLDEIDVENDHGWINPKTAKALDLSDGDWVKLKTDLGEIKTHIIVTHNVVPGVIAISSHGGRWEYGRYASGKKAPYGIELQAPYDSLMWWENEKAHPNWVIDNVSEPISGQQRWMDTVVTVSKA